MSKTVEAIYEGGIFRPLGPIELPEHTRVQISLPASRFISDPRPSADEFDQALKELAAGPSVPTLPSDFSRADIYDDHD